MGWSDRVARTAWPCSVKISRRWSDRVAATATNAAEPATLMGADEGALPLRGVTRVEPSVVT